MRDKLKDAVHQSPGKQSVEYLSALIKHANHCLSCDLFLNNTPFDDVDVVMCPVGKRTLYLCVVAAASGNDFVGMSEAFMTVNAFEIGRHLQAWAKRHEPSADGEDDGERARR